MSSIMGGLKTMSLGLDVQLSPLSVIENPARTSNAKLVAAASAEDYGSIRPWL